MDLRIVEKKMKRINVHSTPMFTEIHPPIYILQYLQNHHTYGQPPIFTTKVESAILIGTPLSKTIEKKKEKIIKEP